MKQTTEDTIKTLSDSGQRFGFNGRDALKKAAALNKERDSLKVSVENLLSVKPNLVKTFL